MLLGMGSTGLSPRANLEFAAIRIPVQGLASLQTGISDACKVLDPTHH
jgi:hypothetical protein